jgi:hypothetical protein
MIFIHNKPRTGGNVRYAVREESLQRIQVLQEGTLKLTDITIIYPYTQELVSFIFLTAVQIPHTLIYERTNLADNSGMVFVSMVCTR